MITLAFVLLYVGCFGFIGYKAYHVWQVTTVDSDGKPLTSLQRVHAAFTSSYTMVWGYAQVAGSFIADNIEKLASFVGIPEAADFITKYTTPAFLGSFLFITGLITLAARIHSLAKG